MLTACVLTASAALALGFFAGLLTFTRSSRWCPACGRVLCCPVCPGRPTPNEVRRLRGAGR